LASRGWCADRVLIVTAASNPDAALIRISVVITPRVRPRLGFGPLLGVITALVALGVAQLVAAFVDSQIGGPVDAVGQQAINNSPQAIKNFAISTFGPNDKTVLTWGIRVVLLIFAVAIGMLAVRWLVAGLAGLAVFIAIGIWASESLPTSSAKDVLPTLVGGAAAALFLWRGRGLADSSAHAARYEEMGPPAPPEEKQEKQAAGRAEVPGWQTWAQRSGEPPQPAESAYASRRRFLVASAGAGAAGALAYVAGSYVAHHRNVTTAELNFKPPAAATSAPPLPPGYDLHIPGLSSFITPNSKFYRVDTAYILPEVLPANWQLRVHGMVERELTLSFHDLIKRPLIEDYITLCCVSNPVGGPYVGNAKWLGASLRSLLQEAGIKAGADQLLCTSVDGFTSGTPVQTAMDGRDALLAVGMNGTALPIEHGFPVRLVIPGLYGYVSACKWITDINVTTYAAEHAYWVYQGWSAQAPIKTESRIDVPALDGNPVKTGTRTPIAGVAWAQHKGIEAVEVRVAGGPWLEAQLAAVPDIDCWRQWVYYWDVTQQPGNYTIEARATDKTGYTQTSLIQGAVPNGASGYPSVQVSVIS
jgi:DMSO/TMAO reductase YedYZ molybdopterin-dependent catalytic subunit